MPVIYTVVISWGNKWAVCSICGSKEKFIKIVVGKYKGRRPLGRWAQMQG